MKILRNYKCYIMVIIIIVIVFLFYNICYYKINIRKNYKKSFLYYKNLETSNSAGVLKFMNYVSNGEYERAFEILSEYNRINMFDNSIENFINKLETFENSYSSLKYNTIFSMQQNDYLEEEIICSLYDSNNVKKRSIRFNIRNYKNSSETKILILNVN